MKAPLTLTKAQARRFMVRATGLDGGFGDVAAALAHLGFVQIDPINVCGRMHDHILRHRVRGYREQDLMRHLHREGPRCAFEHHLPDSNNLAALPLDAWPHLQQAMRERERGDSVWSGKPRQCVLCVSRSMLCAFGLPDLFPGMAATGQ